jgi:hypothetical protein
MSMEMSYWLNCSVSVCDEGCVFNGFFCFSTSSPSIIFKKTKFESLSIYKSIHKKQQHKQRTMSSTNPTLIKVTDKEEVEAMRLKAEEMLIFIGYKWDEKIKDWVDSEGNDEEMRWKAEETLRFMGYKWNEKNKDWVDSEDEDEESEDEESEAEEDKYDGDDWHWVYGKMIVDNEDEDTGVEWKDVVLNIAGGGDHWENWIMRPKMNYIENKDGLHPQHGKVLIQSSCGKYLSFQDKDYECDEDEIECEYEFAVEC